MERKCSVTNFIIENITEDLLFSRFELVIGKCLDTIKNIENSIKAIMDGHMIFNGCMVMQISNEEIKINMKDYMSNINPIDLDRGRLMEKGEMKMNEKYETN